tara:strand:+ start:4248 stop:6272 length:2025 start_codon:yes stop_codon:yes gene_type:complete
MPNSYHDITYTNQTSVQFTNNDLKYLETAHLSMILTNTSTGVSTTFLQTDTGTDGSNPPFTVTVDAGTTTINLTNTTVPAGTNRLRINRVTPSTSLLTSFTNSSLLRAEDLNQNSEQLLFVLQEQLDAGTGSLPLTASDEYDASNRNIINLKDATEDKDAINLGQVAAFVAGIGNTPSVPQAYSFALGTSTAGTVANGNTTFTLSPTPTSSIDGTFIVEVGGVVQRPTTDFTVDGNVLTILGQSLNTSAFNGTTCVAQNFGVSRNVFNFPVTGEAGSSSEIPITLKGASSGDATAVLKVTDSANAENANISAGGTIKAKVIEPITSGTLAVNPTTITTTGAIVSNGDLSVGDGFSVTETTGDTTVNKLTISASNPQNFGASLAVPKSYVDSTGGLVGSGLPTDQNLNGLTTAQRLTGVVPNSPASFNYPAPVSAGEKVMIIVNLLGGTSSTTLMQELLVFSTLTQQTHRYVRVFDGTDFSGWSASIQASHRISDLTAPNADFSMNNNKITSLATPTASTDALTKGFVENNDYQPYHRRIRAAFVGTATFPSSFDIENETRSISYLERDGVNDSSNEIKLFSSRIDASTTHEYPIEVAIDLNPDFSNVNYTGVVEVAVIPPSGTTTNIQYQRLNMTTGSTLATPKARGNVICDIGNGGDKSVKIRGYFFSLDQQN